MLIPVININLCQFLIPDYQQILRILFFRSFSKIKTSGYYSFLINDYDLVVGDGVLGIYVSGYSHVAAKSPALYFSDLLDLSNMISTWTPFLYAFTKAFAIGVDVKEYV
jgi:hypothetical protein